MRLSIGDYLISSHFTQFTLTIDLTFYEQEHSMFDYPDIMCLFH